MTDTSASSVGEDEASRPPGSATRSSGQSGAALSDLETIKAEVDALQIALHDSRSPWYKSVPTTVAVVALLLSLTTFYINEKRADAQDLQRMRSDFRTLLQRIAQLPREDVEASRRYPGEPHLSAMIKGLLNQENAILSKQAAELARQLPRESMTASEYYSVAMALQFSYNLHGAREFMSLAIESSRDFNDRIAALRASANLEFQMGNPEEARVIFQRALGIFKQEEFSGYDTLTQGSTLIWTELSWAGAEYQNGTAEFAMQHIREAERLVGTLRPSQLTNQLKAEIGQARVMMALEPSSPTAPNIFNPLTNTQLAAPVTTTP